MKPPLVLVPGAFCEGWAFDAWRPALEAAGHRCLDADLLDGARSAAGLSLTRYADAAARAARGAASPPVIVGHSLGGLVAQLAAARAPCAGLVLLAPSPAWGQPVASAAELASGPALAAVQGPYWLGSVRPDWGVMREFTLDRLPLAEARSLYARMRPESGRALFEVLNWWGDVTMAAYAPPLRAPALVVTGADDRVHTPASTAVTAARLGAAQVTAPGVSHWTLGGPGAERALDAVLGWLAARAPVPA